jgi:ATP-dependent DNA helicase UvrD/PcrA
LSELLPDDYRDGHLEIAELFRRLLYDGGITDAEIAELEEGLERPFAEIEAALGRDEEGEAHQGIETEDGVPSIICTSLLGAKGLSAGYVFIVGFNDGVFPGDPDAISDDEICKLIVGLSRTRKECHLVSCGFWGTGFLKPSSFLRWLDVPIETRTVTKMYWS